MQNRQLVSKGDIIHMIESILHIRANKRDPLTPTLYGKSTSLLGGGMGWSGHVHSANMETKSNNKIATNSTMMNSIESVKCKIKVEKIQGPQLTLILVTDISFFRISFFPYCSPTSLDYCPFQLMPYMKIGYRFRLFSSSELSP